MSEFCGNCGSAVHGSRFCPTCGQPTTANSAGETPTTVPTPPVPITPVTPVPPSAPAGPAPTAQSGSSISGTAIGLIIGGGLVVLALLAVGAMFLVMNSNNDDTVPVVSSQSSLAPPPSPTPTVTATATATATVTAPPAPVIPAQPAFGGCPSGFTYVGQYGGYDVCRNSTISDGFAANIASAVSGPGAYSGVYSPARDKEYYFTCISVGSGVIDCGYPPTNISNGGVVRLYP